MKIKINITKEVLKESMRCPLLWATKDDSTFESIKNNCAVAVAVRDIFPVAIVFQGGMIINGFNIKFTPTTTKYIWKFDNVKKYEDRLSLPEYSFEVDIPDFIIDEIGIDQVHAILKESKTLSIASLC